MFFKKLLKLQVVFFLLSCAHLPDREALRGFEELSASVSSLYTIMGKYDIRKSYIRENIRKFFCTEEDMDGFIFEKNHELSKFKIKDGRVLDFSIENIEEHNESTSVKIAYKVKEFFPLLKRVIHTTDEWIRTDDGWCLIFRKKIKLGG